MGLLCIMASKARCPPLKIIRTVFQDPHPSDSSAAPRFVLVVDMQDHAGVSTSDIPDLIDKMQQALPGIFPDDASPYVHSCGGGAGSPEHPFRDEIERGTDIPHLLEHVLLHLLSRRHPACSAFCGQRSIDLEQGITTHHYLVMDYPSKLEAIVAADLGFELVRAWVEGRTVSIDSATVLDGIRALIEPMVQTAA